ncbi:MAG: hypothetical protein PHV74_06795 [Dehalococcoidia bacterium]|nr:hypothetical protein [Dehalococcoidia bacterium]
MIWHGQPCKVICKAPFKKGVKRNALMEASDVRLAMALFCGITGPAFVAGMWYCYGWPQERSE